MGVALVAVVAGCDPGDSTDDPAGGGETPGALVGSWYAGRGGTTAPYDPVSGTFGRPSGSGLLYLFQPGGRYLKGFQSYESSGGCTTGFTVTEQGVIYATDSTLTTHPTSGRRVFEDTCAPSLDSDDPVTDLADETFTWEVSGDDPTAPVLSLVRTDGAAATFVRQ